MVKVLLDCGANLRCSGDKLQTPLHKASAVGSLEIVDLLIRKVIDSIGPAELRKVHKFITFISKCHDTFCPWLLIQMVTDEDCDKNTSLLLAIESGNEQVVEKLISYGSNVNHINKVLYL